VKKPDHIPKLPHAFFKWYCKANRYEELHGDLEEYYYDRIEAQGLVKARLLYWRDVIRCCQPYAWKKPKGYSNSNIIMFKNYFKTSLRTMMRNPLSSFINIFGLAVAIGVSIVVYSMIQFSYSIDQYHENKHEVFLSTFTSDKEGTPQRYGVSPVPLGQMLKDDLSQITRMSRVDDHGVVIKHGENVFQESVRFVDPDFLHMLTFPLKWGDKSALNDRSGIILSEEMAIKYFGYNEPIGQEMLVKFNEESKKTFRVVGVTQAFVEARAISFDFLINFENLEANLPDFKPNDWTLFIDGLLVQTNNAADIIQVQSSMDKYLDIQNKAVPGWEFDKFGFTSVADLHEDSKYIAHDISTDLAEEILIGLPVMGGFILALACFNYMNMSIGSSTRRLKEIGVRKVVGANRRKVMVQFLAENVFSTLFALAAGLILAATLFLPWFGTIADTSLSMQVLDVNLWVFLIIIVLTTGIVSGFYPALYVSRFQVVNIFKGTVRFGKKNPIMKTFLGLQMILAFVFITMAVMFNENSNWQAQRPWGYNQQGALFVDAADHSAYTQLRDALSQNPNITHMSGAENHIGKSVWQSRIKLAEKHYEVQGLKVGPEYFETFGIELHEGAVFKQQRGETTEIMVNELFVENTLLTDPIGQFVSMDTVQYQIVGVVKDFHTFNFFANIKPMIFIPAAEEDFRYLTMRVREGAEIAVFDDLRDQWAELFPETPFQGGLQIDLWADFYMSLQKMKKFTRTVAFVAVLLAALGLYGLVSLNVSGRAKEFSIRKVLGARLKNITVSISKQYMVLMSIALVIGAPAAYALNMALLNMMFAESLPHGHWSVLIGLFLILAIMFAVMCTQIRKVTLANPADGLRTE